MTGFCFLMPISVPAGGKVLPRVAMVPAFASLMGKLSFFRHSRFIYSCCQLAEVDMSIYRDKFSQRMALAGIKPHHRIAIAVSGGPDSVALCVLTAWWKSSNFITTETARSKPFDGILGIVVDHGLRTESAEEANLVSHRIMDMGIKCEVAQCEWLEGKPRIGHLQEAARNKRYAIMQTICLRESIGILLIAHHADDQAELFILRLSRNSGVLGLAGMAFIAEIFPKYPELNGEGLKTHGIFLVRPLLEFSKQDLYNICRGARQEWVEDPTNRSSLFARNRIRLSLKKFSSSAMVELREVISSCRETRSHVEKFCRMLLNQTVTITPHGYAVLDVERILSMELNDIYISRAITLVLQFVSQKHRPVRGKALKLLLRYFRTYPCKSCLTVAGCYLCPAPESKGTKILICCSVNPSFPPTTKTLHPYSYRNRSFSDTDELKQIVSEREAHLDRYIPDASSVRFLDAAFSDSTILEEFHMLGILSPSTYHTIVSLKTEETEKFKSKAESMHDSPSGDDMGSVSDKYLCPGQDGYFMDRFVLHWINNMVSCKYCSFDDRKLIEVRYMIDSDWMHIFDLAKANATQSGAIKSTEKAACVEAMKFAVNSARKALSSLKSIPAAARRAMPVLIDTKGVLLSIPGIGYSRCSCLIVTAVFKPRVPLGGGYSSFM